MEFSLLSQGEELVNNYKQTQDQVTFKTADWKSSQTGVYIKYIDKKLFQQTAI